MLKNLQRKQKNPRFCVGENGLCLRFFDSANRTLSSTSTAIYTEVCGNFALVANFADCVARANTNAIFTSNTIVADFVSHSDILLFWVDSIIRPKKILSTVFQHIVTPCVQTIFFLTMLAQPSHRSTNNARMTATDKLTLETVCKNASVASKRGKNAVVHVCFCTANAHIYRKIQTCLKRFSC